MNDGRAKLLEPAAETPLRGVPRDELERTLEAHRKWVESGGKEGKRANLSGAQLQGADLTGAQLRKASLGGAQLSMANLRAAELQGAFLGQAQLQKADLRRAQLQGAFLGLAQLQGADLTGAQLRKADLREAVLSGTRLRGAQLQGADLAGATFEQQELSHNGQSAPIAPSADLTDADLRDADLSNAQLAGVTGLRTQSLAGADLTNAKLPPDIAKFDTLAHAADISRDASKLFFGLLAANLYSWLTIATTTDVELIAGRASSPLPIIGTEIALAGFYWVAPLILLSAYFYFHLYLQRLWLDLSTLPAVFPDGKALDEKAYPWLLNGLARAHFNRLGCEHRRLARPENYLSILLAWWVVPLTLLAFWLRYIPRHDWLGTGLHVISITIASWFGVHAYRLAVQTLSGTAKLMEKKPGVPSWTRAWHAVRGTLPDKWTVGLSALTLALSLNAAINPTGPHDRRPGLAGYLSPNYRTFADLRDAEISTKPPNWAGREGTAEAEMAQVKGADLQGRDLRHASASGAFLVKARLDRADLRGASLSKAWLQGATLLWADLREADLAGAQLQGAVLIGARLQGAALWTADLRGADLSGAQLRSADLAGAQLQGANFWRANLSGADLRGANLQNARLQGACGDEQIKLPEGITIEPCPGE